MNITHFQSIEQLTLNQVNTEHARFLAVLTKKPQGQVHYDLSTLVTCDSSGLALLMDARRLCKKYNLELIIAPIPDNVHALAMLYVVEKIILGIEEEA